MARRLRIAVSVFFAVVAVAFAVLWVRSYFRSDTLQFIYGVQTRIFSNNGYILFVRVNTPALIQNMPAKRRPTAGLPKQGWSVFSTTPNDEAAGFEWHRSPYRLIIHIPYWFILSFAIPLAIAPLPLRYSLRTMLIATTLV